MIIRKTPKNKENYYIINNIQMICDLANLGIMPKYMDGYNSYYVKNLQIEEYLKDKEQSQWMS